MGRCPHRFGPAGKPIDFKGDLEEIPEFLKGMGLDAMEYEAVRGVNIKMEKAVSFGRAAQEHGVLLSLHGPYYINLASPNEKTYRDSVRRVFESLRASHWMGAYAVVIHTGYYGDLGPREALQRAVSGYKEAIEQALSEGYDRPHVSPETTGRTAQIGTVEEVVEICQAIGARCRPTVDWAHLYARSHGELVREVGDVVKVIDYIEKSLGREAVTPLHTHFSKIEFGKGGEREHHTLAEELYGPDFSVVIRAYKEIGVTGTFISESPILERDALVMKKICEDVY